MKKIELQDIYNKLFDVRSNCESRESASDWAINIQFEMDQGLMECSPINMERSIWKGIEFLTGIDLRIAPNQYLHSQSDIEDYLRKIKLELDI